MPSNRRYFRAGPSAHWGSDQMESRLRSDAVITKGGRRHQVLSYTVGAFDLSYCRAVRCWKNPGRARGVSGSEGGQGEHAHPTRDSLPVDSVSDGNTGGDVRGARRLSVRASDGTNGALSHERAAAGARALHHRGRGRSLSICRIRQSMVCATSWMSAESAFPFWETRRFSAASRGGVGAARHTLNSTAESACSCISMARHPVTSRRSWSPSASLASQRKALLARSPASLEA